MMTTPNTISQKTSAGSPETEVGKEQLGLESVDGAEVAAPPAEHIGTAEHDCCNRWQQTGIAYRLAGERLTQPASSTPPAAAQARHVMK